MKSTPTIRTLQHPRKQNAAPLQPNCNRGLFARRKSPKWSNVWHVYVKPSGAIQIFCGSKKSPRHKKNLQIVGGGNFSFIDNKRKIRYEKDFSIFGGDVVRFRSSVERADHVCRQLVEKLGNRFQGFRTFFRCVLFAVQRQEPNIHRRPRYGLVCKKLYYRNKK